MRDSEIARSPIPDQPRNMLEDAIAPREYYCNAKDLAQEIIEGNFRQELFFRLNVMVLEPPLLRERRENIPLLCNHLLHRFNKKMNLRIDTVSTKSMALLMV